MITAQLDEKFIVLSSFKEHRVDNIVLISADTIDKTDKAGDISNKGDKDVDISLDKLHKRDINEDKLELEKWTFRVLVSVELDVR